MHPLVSLLVEKTQLKYSKYFQSYWDLLICISLIFMNEEPGMSLVLMNNFKKCFKNLNLKKFKEGMERETDLLHIYI